MARTGSGHTSRSAERRGRGIRGPIIPPDLPGHRTRADRFDRAVLEAFARIDHRLHERLERLDIAVDEVPKIRAIDPDSIDWPPEVVAEGPVPLSRLVPAGIDRRGETTRARIVLFRRPLERRAQHPEDLEDLLYEVLVEQVATYLGVEPEVVDPEFDDDI
ncbi:metallopeptidase family protein [Rhodococcus sp. Eu-32]|uniref:metallopeptidase family protein n=1 Tax=Rhodococcus sp. Eu-32 TaxID=1017319 RepID=UPI000DF1CED6|nr:metallopeptidase family protein [Rhodococcus sp. Eu-32]RRQ26475.1 metallopeptidase family protein [Rhodococcus sp. Eu-32]